MTTRSPYRGIVPYGYADRAYFAGREHDVADLSAKILLYKLVVLFGESGAGKSSLLNAGIIPRLMDEEFVVETLRVRAFADGPIVVERISSGDPTTSYLPSLFTGTEPQDNAPQISCSLSAFESQLSAADSARPPVLIFDQFEELFTLFKTPDKKLQESILDLIYKIIEGRLGNADKPVPVKVVIGIREDFLGRLEVLARRYPQIFDRRVRLGLLTDEGARRAILGPFDTKRLAPGHTSPFRSSVAQGLANDIVAEFKATSETEGIHPTPLQIVCSRLWDRFSLDAAPDAAAADPLAAGRVASIGAEQHKELNFNKGILEGFFHSEFDKLPEASRPIASRVLSALVTDAGTRDVVSETRVKEAAGADDQTVSHVVTLLESRRFINATPHHGAYYYEIASEYLVAAIRGLRLEQVRLESQIAYERMFEEQTDKLRQKNKRRLFWMALGGAVLLIAVAFLAQQRNSAENLKQFSDAMLDVATSQESAGRASESLVSLARVLDRDPRNEVARARILNQLLYRNWPLLRQAVQHKAKSVIWSEFSPDGARIATASDDQTAEVWDVATGAAVRAPFKHDARVFFVRFDPTGKRLMTASDDRAVRLWDIASGRSLTLEHTYATNGNSERVVITAMAMNSDGSRIATGAVDGSFKIWNAETGGATFAGTVENRARIGVVQFNGDGTRLLVASDDAAVRVWNLTATTKKPVIMRGHAGVVNAARFSRNGQRIVSASSDETARVWDVATGRQILSLLHDGKVLAAEFGPNDRVILTSTDLSVRLWDPASGKQIGDTMRHPAGVVAASISPEGDRILTASQDLSARLWSAETGLPIAEPMWHQAPPTAAQFSRDGQSVVTASADGWARVWDVRSGAALPSTLHADEVWSAQFDPKGTRLVVAGRDGTLIWNPDNPAETRLIDLHDSSWAEFSADGQMILTVSGQEARTWDAASLSALSNPMRHELGVIASAHFSPDGKSIVTAASDRTARTWDSRTGQAIATLDDDKKGHATRLKSAAFGGDGQHVVTIAESDATARLWQILAGSVTVNEIQHEGPISSANFSPDGTLLVTASVDRTARIWSAAGGPARQVLQHYDKVSQAQFSPDASQIATASEDRIVRVWDTKTGHLLGPGLVHRVAVDAAQFSPDGRRLATATHEGAVRVWEVRTGLPVSPPLPSADSIRTLQFDATGRLVVAASADGHVRVWRIPFGLKGDSETLSRLAKAVGGFRLIEGGVPVRWENPLEELRILSRLFAESKGQTESESIGQWFFSDRSSRTVSPFSKTTIADFLRTLLKDSGSAAQREAATLFPSDPRIPPTAPPPVVVPREPARRGR